MTDRPKFLVDFDGVWTELFEQAKAVDEARIIELAKISGWSEKEIASCMEEIFEVMRGEPLKYGWLSGDRITAYADEDPFLFHTAAVASISVVAKLGNSRLQRLTEVLKKAGHNDLTQLGSEIFVRASHGYLAESGHSLLPEACGVLKELTAIADVVFCTNFSSDAVAKTWTKHGFDFTTDKSLTLRGLAQKHYLSGPEKLLAFGGRQVAIDRGHYLSALLEEQPDVVVGDVFSLDLALPLSLRAKGDEFKELQCVLFLTPFTPEWSTTMCGKVDGLTGIRSLSRLVDLAKTLVGSGD